MTTLFDDTTRGADLSDSGTYRYRLWRTWSSEPHLGWVMLNPSIADAEIDDRTILKCMKYARRHGAGGIVVCNLFAYRAQNPLDLLNALRAGVDVVGPENDTYLRRLARRHQTPDVGLIVAAWGATGGHKVWPRIETVERLFADEGHQLHCLDVTAEGQPRHPLYLRDDIGIHEYT